MAIDLEIVGGGKMGEALLAGLLRAGWDEGGIAVVEPVEARRTELAQHYPGLGVRGEPASADGVVLAVKPADVDAACAAIGRAGAGRLLSIAAGCPVARLEAAHGAGSDIHVVRALPNTPVL